MNDGVTETLSRFVLRWGKILLSGFIVYDAFYPMAPLEERGLFLLGLFFLVFFHQITRTNRRAGKGAYALLLLLSLIVFGYVILSYNGIEIRSGLVLPGEIVLAVLAVVIILESTRRVVGWPLAALAVFFLAYAVFGEYLPRFLGGYGGFDIRRMTTFLYLSDNGIFGVVTYVLFKYVFLFVMFGKLLEASGAMSYIIDLCRRLVGRFTGGPAMVAVVSSGFMGSISGSAVANVMVTGSVTIPLMKKVGFEPQMAGAVEAAASTGGQFMPPVMGAAAFLIAQFLGISYLAVVKAAVIPAVLYYFGVLAAVYVYSARSGLKGLDPADLPRLRKIVVRPEGLVFWLSVLSLIYFLVKGFSPIRAALYAMAVGVLVSWVKPAQGLGVKKVLKAMEETAGDFLMIGVAGACVGIIMAVLLMTGLAMRFSFIVIGLAGGSLLIALFLTMIASIVLGMGLPTSIAYIVLAMTSAPALIQLGVLPLAAHFFIFYTGMMAMVTPPVALAAYAGATLAGADFWRTGVRATILALPANLIAFAFVYDPAFLGVGSPFHILRVSLTAALGVGFLSFALIGRVKNSREIVGRVLAFPAALLLIAPLFLTDLIGLALGLSGLAVCYGSPLFGRLGGALSPSRGGDGSH